MFKLFFSKYKSEIKKQHDWKVVGMPEVIVLFLAMASMYPLFNTKNLSNPVLATVCLLLMVVFLALEHFWAAPRTRKMYGRSHRTHKTSNPENHVDEPVPKDGQTTWFLERRVEKARELVTQSATDLGIANKEEYIDHLIAECDRFLDRTKHSKVIADNLKPVIPVISFILLWSFFSLCRIEPPDYSSDEILREAFLVLTQGVVENSQLLMQFLTLMVLVVFAILYCVFIFFPILAALVDYDWTLVEELRSALIYLKQTEKTSSLSEKSDSKDEHHALSELSVMESDSQ